MLSPNNPFLPDYASVVDVINIAKGISMTGLLTGHAYAFCFLQGAGIQGEFSDTAECAFDNLIGSRSNGH